MLAACQRPRIDVTPCLFGSELAFKLGDSTRWFWKETARPRQIEVYAEGQYAQGDRTRVSWSTALPFELQNDPQKRFQPKREFIRYGQRLANWNVIVEPATLEPRRTYIVEVHTDGGEGMAEIIVGERYPQCR